MSENETTHVINELNDMMLRLTNQYEITAKEYLMMLIDLNTSGKKVLHEINDEYEITVFTSEDAIVVVDAKNTVRRIDEINEYNYYESVPYDILSPDELDVINRGDYIDVFQKMKDVRVTVAIKLSFGTEKLSPLAIKGIRYAISIFRPSILLRPM